MPVPAFADIGKGSKELFQGSKAGGAFVLDPKVTFTSKTSTGVSFTTTLVKKGDKVEPSLKTSYSAKNYSADATIDTSEKISLNAAFSEVAPGLKVSGSVVLNDFSSAKVGIDYVIPYLNLKSAVSLVSTPVVDVAVSSGYEGYVGGVEASYSTAKAAIAKWSAALGYHAADFQIAAAVADFGNTIKLSYSHNVSVTQVVGAEVSRKLSAGATSFAVAYQKKINKDATWKVKLDNTGLLSTLYETRLASGEKVAGAFQLQATDVSKPVKYGFSIDLL